MLRELGSRRRKLFVVIEAHVVARSWCLTASKEWSERVAASWGVVPVASRVTSSTQSRKVAGMGSFAVVSKKALRMSLAKLHPAMRP